LGIKNVALQRILEDEWVPALTCGVAVGAVEVDCGQYQNADAPTWRAARWHMLALPSSSVRADDGPRGIING
jgi:hypothetical protein